VKDYGIPILRPHLSEGVYINSQLATLRQFASCGEVKDPTPFVAAVHIAFEKLYLRMKFDLEHVAPLNVKQCIRGTTHTNPLNTKAGYGFPHFQLKKSQIICGSLDDPVFEDWFAEELCQGLELMDRGIPYLNVAVANVKDEIIKQDKIDKGMERIFFAGNTPFLIYCRMYLSPIMDVFMANRDFLPGQIGMNAMGSEFATRLQTMYDMLEDSDYAAFSEMMEKAGWMDSDYAKYDKTLLILCFGVYLLWLLVQRCPFYMVHPVEMNRVKMILQSLQQYVIIIGVDVFLMHKYMPSGVFGTAWVNCLCELLLEILQFYFCLHISINKIVPTRNFVLDLSRSYNFFDFVALINYGDDNLKYVFEHYRHIYSHDNIMKFCDFIQMTLTPARKEDKTIEFKTLDQVSFLKRTPVYDPELVTIHGKLEFNSIGRMLAFRDTNDSQWEQMVFQVALLELSVYPSEVYERFCDIFCITPQISQTMYRYRRYAFRYDQSESLNKPMMIPLLNVEELENDLAQCSFQAESGLTKQTV